jgi:hypothetical protein
MSLMSITRIGTDTLQLGGNLIRALPPVIGIFLEAFCDESVERWRNIGSRGGKRRRVRR